MRIVIGFPPGAGSDIVTRLVTPGLTKALGQQFVVDNRAGATGNIAAELVARAPPDGYTLLTVTASLAINQSLYKKPPVNLTKDFDAVALLGTVPFVLVVHPSLPVRSAKAFVAFAKARPGQVSFASTGQDGSPHLTAEMLRMQAALDLLHVPYKGTPQATTDLISGQVTMMFANTLSVLPSVNAGRLRALAVTSVKRSSAAPDIPTMIEAGFAGFESGTWFSLAAPAGTPGAAIQRLNAEVNRVVQLQDVRDKFAVQGAEPLTGNVEQTAAYVRSEIDKWAKVVKASATKVE
ncbi:MAG TPA: tripartite tricarboxylate transporter substrate binding protein [Burkholderiales bacterium]|nr:tripartite tricarboxylate transporter substrate binding protein [Burkholderiales bacterium]